MSLNTRSVGRPGSHLGRTVNVGSEDQKLAGQVTVGGQNNVQGSVIGVVNNGSLSQHVAAYSRLVIGIPLVDLD